MDAEAGEGGEIVVGVGWADVAGLFDEVVSDGADASSILIYLIFPTEGSGVAVWNAFTSHEVIADDADALAEDIIVYLIERAANGDWLWPRGRGSVDCILRSSFGRAHRSTLLAAVVPSCGKGVTESCSL